MASVDTSGSSSGSGSSLTTAGIAVASNGNRVLDLVVMLGNSSVSVSSVTRDGQSATLVRRLTATNVALEVWRIVAPNTGTATAAASFSGSVGEAYVAWLSAYNVNQASPSTTTQESASNAWSTGSIAPTSTSTSDLVVGYFGWDRGGSANLTFTSPVTAHVNNNSLNWRGVGVGSRVGTGGADTVEAALSPGIGSGGVLIGYALVHDAGGGGGGGASSLKRKLLLGVG